ncbi:kinesin-like protein KIF20B [Oenanthe melanoleuca]|uniref:kinesin-like protein KIF20B n=1 Tax=Oenanthe melanoleuca TaxID=2939378 RepID=UPI0024C121D9|nr:kinesin-like protein KIF20B [Oenanthe melanoleuca]
MLVNLVEELTYKLITEKKNNLLLEMKIHEEVMHYFLQREADFKECLAQERAHLEEENSEQFLEIFKEHASSSTENADERSESQDGPFSYQAASLMAASQSVTKEYPSRRQDSTRNQKSAKKKQGRLQKIGNFFQSSSTVIYSKAKKLIETISSPETTEPENVKENENILRPKRAKRRLRTTDISCPLDSPGSSISVEPKENESDLSKEQSPLQPGQRLQLRARHLQLPLAAPAAPRAAALTHSH